MPHTDANAAASACERLRTAIRDEPWDRIAPGIALTAGIGVATMGTSGALGALAELADQRLYTPPRARARPRGRLMGRRALASRPPQSPTKLRVQRPSGPVAECAQFVDKRSL